jgi:small subunit ribosomal protein S21
MIHLAQVLVKPGEHIDSALKRFKKVVMNSGITKEARSHERYEKPSDRKRREIKASIRKIQRAKAKAAERY